MLPSASESPLPDSSSSAASKPTVMKIIIRARSVPKRNMSGSRMAAISAENSVMTSSASALTALLKPQSAPTVRAAPSMANPRASATSSSTYRTATTSRRDVGMAHA